MKVLALLFTSLLLASSLLGQSFERMLFSNNYTEVRKAISLGANVNTRYRNSTPLYDASRKGNWDIAYLLLRRGAKVNAISHGETALHKAVTAQNLHMAKEFLKAGANPNIKDGVFGNTPLQYAINANNAAMISLLLSYGAKMNVVNNLGQTPASFVLKRINIPALSIGNNDITLFSSAFNVGAGSIGLQVTNNTTQYVTVENVALYINGNLINQINTKTPIPPSASLSVGSIPIPFNTYEAMKIKRNGMVTVKYGFAVQYRVGNKQDNFYDTKRTKLKVW